MRADPEPSDCLAVENPDSAVADADAGGIDWRNVIHPLEMQAGMSRVLTKEPVRLPCLMLDVARQ